MKALIFVVSILITLSGCAIAPYGANNGQNHQSPYDFALRQSEEMDVKGNAFLDNATRGSGDCVNVPADKNHSGFITDNNGGISFGLSKYGRKNCNGKGR